MKYNFILNIQDSLEHRTTQQMFGLKNAINQPRPHAHTNTHTHVFSVVCVRLRAMSFLYNDPEWSTNTTAALSRLLGSGPELEDVLEWLEDRSEEEHFSLSDFWGALIAPTIMKQVQGHGGEARAHPMGRWRYVKFSH